MNSQKSKFVYACRTSNGAVSLPTPDPSGKSSGRLTLFFKSVRGLNLPRLLQYMSEASRESLEDTFLLAFHIRDCRGGKGERDIGRKALIWLFINSPKSFEKVMHLIPEYGRWDDLLYFFPKVLDLSDIKFVRSNYCSPIRNEKQLVRLRELQQKVVKLFTNKIKNDVKRMKDGSPCSLAAKWAPTEGDSMDRQFGVYSTLANEMKVSNRSLRKNYLSPLRAYLKIVERFMCNRQWDNINYNNVPSYAMKRLKKSFEKHDEKRFQVWSEVLKMNDPSIARVNAKQLHPHELVREIRRNMAADDVCIAQWSVLEEECKKKGTLNSDIAVIDTSSSMHTPNYLPFDVACAMGLLISKCSVGPFQNYVFTFNSTPQFAYIPDTNLYQRWYTLSNISWGGSTNLQGTFELILGRAKEYKLSQDDMPKRLWIISDMQFNQVDYGHYTNFEAIDKMYRQAGYTRPRIVFWNVIGDTNDFPVSVGDDGTALISGFSPSIMKAVLSKDGSFSPYGIMRKSLDDTRYSRVLEALS